MAKPLETPLGIKIVSVTLLFLSLGGIVFQIIPIWLADNIWVWVQIASLFAAIAGSIGLLYLKKWAFYTVIAGAVFWLVEIHIIRVIPIPNMGEPLVDLNVLIIAYLLFKRQVFFHTTT